MIFTSRGGNHGSDIKLTYRKVSDGICEVDVLYTLEKKEIPAEFTLCTSIPARDIYSIWGPSCMSHRTVGRDYDWTRTGARIAAWLPLHCAISRNGKNRVCMALSDAFTPTEIRSGVSEDNGDYRWEISFFTSPTTPISKYRATVRIDTRELDYYDSIYDVTAWWERECGYIPAPVPDAARLPMNSLWYSYHQVLMPDEIVRQCELSKPLGMDTVIIDDGWQTNDSNRGYAFCGDWEPVRMPDMKGLSDRIHNTGMKVMLWFAVPFIGKKAKRFEEFKDFVLDKNTKNDVHCLDPRYPHVREYLVQTYERAVREWDLDGLKLDFIDSFCLTETSISPDPRRDLESLEDGVDALMVAVTESLRRIKPDILIEFRQAYVGPAIRKDGNMLRVMDCPVDPMFNRRGIVDLRLTSGKSAVHSDMLMWHTDDTKESVALQLAATLYGVPQISMIIDELPREHYDTLKHYLSFWREHREILLDGRFTAKNPETFYSQVCAELNGEAVVTVYEDTAVKGEYKKLVIVNAGITGSVYLKGMQGKSYRTLDCTGKPDSSGSVDSQLIEIPVSLGGMVFVE